MTAPIFTTARGDFDGTAAKTQKEDVEETTAGHFEGTACGDFEGRGRDDGGNKARTFTCLAGTAANMQNRVMASASARRIPTRAAQIFGKRNNLASGNIKLLEQTFCLFC